MRGHPSCLLQSAGAEANRILLASALSSMRIICPNKVSRRDWIIAVSLGASLASVHHHSVQIGTTWCRAAYADTTGRVHQSYVLSPTGNAQHDVTVLPVNSHVWHTIVVTHSVHYTCCTFDTVYLKWSSKISSRPRQQHISAGHVSLSISGLYSTCLLCIVSEIVNIK